MRKHSYSEPTRTNRSAIVWSLLTVLMLLGVLATSCVFLQILVNPYSALNPFPPPTLPPPVVMPSATATALVLSLPATWTPTFTPTVPASETPVPSATLPATPTPITLTPTPTVTLPPPAAGYPYEVRTGSPKAIPNIYHPELECGWMGLGGQVVDRSDAPVTGLIIRLGGRAAGIDLDENTFTLTGVALSYGRAGYEFKLADEPVASKNKLWVQLVNQAGVPLSQQVYLETFADCNRNLIIIDFKQVR